MNDIKLALETAIYYNGYEKVVREWSNLKPTTGENLLFRPPLDYNDYEVAQLELIWMILVVMFGDWGTSPRYGWIDNISEFINFLRQITEV